MRGKMEQKADLGRIPMAFLLKTLAFSYLLTGALLAVLAFFLYRLGLGEKAVSAALIAIYVAVPFFGGHMAGKKMKNRRFLWGMLLGAAYFLVLAAVSFAAGPGEAGFGTSFFTTLALCVGGGMLGGMLS